MSVVDLPTDLRPRIARAVRLLASDRDGEVVAAARALRRTLGAAGLDLNDLGDVIEREPAERVVYVEIAPDPKPDQDVPTWANLTAGQRQAWLAMLPGLDCLKPFEREFAASVGRQAHGPSAKQAAVLDAIIAKAASWGWRPR